MSKKTMAPKVAASSASSTSKDAANIAQERIPRQSCTAFTKSAEAKAKFWRVSKYDDLAHCIETLKNEGETECISFLWDVIQVRNSYYCGGDSLTNLIAAFQATVETFDFRYYARIHEDIYPRVVSFARQLAAAEGLKDWEVEGPPPTVSAVPIHEAKSAEIDKPRSNYRKALDLVIDRHNGCASPVEELILDLLQDYGGGHSSPEYVATSIADYHENLALVKSWAAAYVKWDPASLQEIAAGVKAPTGSVAS